MSVSFPKSHQSDSFTKEIPTSSIEIQQDAIISAVVQDKKFLAQLSITTRPASEHEINEVKEKIKEISEKIDVLAIETLSPCGISGSIILETLKNVDTLFKKARMEQESRILAKIQMEGDSKHLYVYFDNKDQHNIQLIFDRHVDSGHEVGDFKILRAAYNLSIAGVVERQFFSKEHVGDFNVLKELLTQPIQHYEDEQYIIVKRYQSITNEMRMANAKIPGTPEVHFIIPYIGKNNILKLGTLSRCYPGGDLQNRLSDRSSLAIKDRIEILYKVTETLFKMHAEGYSHNDIKLENIVLDEHLNPVIIDFGATTKDDEHIVASTPQYLPPEMVNRSLIDLYDAGNERLFSLENEITNIDSKIAYYETKKGELDDYLFWGEPTENLPVDLKGERSLHKSKIKRLNKKLTNSLLSQEKMQQIHEKIKVIGESINTLNQKIGAVKALMKAYKNEIAHLQFLKTIFIEQRQQLDESTNNLLDDIHDSINYEGCVRQKNDIYALGLTADELFPEEERTLVLSNIIEGMLHNDPAERWTSERIFSELNTMVNTSTAPDRN